MACLDPLTLYRSVSGFQRNEVSDGFVIYDGERDYVHFLNPTAAAVLELCDGLNAEAIALAVQQAFQLPFVPIADVEACLDTLIAQELVIPAP
jgi:Coenzyme PQQ synthesis protein D (PqqD)